MRDKKVTFIVQAAVIAALYVVLTFVANALGLASHTIQVRFSEALFSNCHFCVACHCKHLHFDSQSFIA